ncbi:MAG: hypothetical protein ACRC20_10455 [Segniliparus sp.]|uniref:hypothetical protein n=1 Tax=Segniliparus sp. TaxID=2804064 RepID=UPI003F30DE94
MTNPYPGGEPPRWQEPQRSHPRSGQYPQGAPYQQPFPHEQPPFRPAPKKRSRAWVYVSIAVSLLVVISVGTFLLIRVGLDRPANAVATNSAGKQGSAPSKSTPPPPPPEPGRSRPGPNTPPGWQSVGSPSGLDYDVPGDWTVQKPKMVLSWQKPCSNGPAPSCAIRSLLNTSTRPHPPQDGCTDGNVSAAAGFLSPSPTEIAEAERQTIADALEAEAKRVPDLYTDWGHDAAVPPPPPPPITRSEVRQFKIDGADALQASFTATGMNTSVNCNPPSGVYTVVATTNTAGKVVTFAVQLDQGYPQAPDPAVAQKIIDTLRVEKH